MNKSAFIGALGLSAALLLPAAGAQAATQILSNFGPNKTSDSSHWGNTIGPATQGAGYTSYLASSFTTPGFGIFLDHLDLALTEAACGNSLAVGAAVDLVADDGGAHWLVTKLPSDCGATKLTKLKSKKVPVLAANTPYWVVVTPIGFDDFTIYLVRRSGEWRKRASQQ